MVARHHLQRLFVSAMVIDVMVLIAWVLDPLSSPLGFRYVIDHLAWANFFEDLNMLPTLASAHLSANPRDPNETVNWLVFLLQWGIVGYTLAVPFFRSRRPVSPLPEESPDGQDATRSVQ